MIQLSSDYTAAYFREDPTFDYWPNEAFKQWCSRNSTNLSDTLYLICSEEFCNFKAFWKYNILKNSTIKVLVYKIAM